MTYYKPSLSSDSEVVGNVYPQIQRFDSDINLYTKEAIQLLSRRNIPLPDDVELPPFALEHEAILTDFLSTNLIHNLDTFLVSKSAFDLLKTYALPSYKIYPIEVLIQSGGIELFYLLHFSTESNNCIDFGKTKVCRKNSITNSVEELNLNSKDDYISTLKKTQLPFKLTIPKPQFSEMFFEKKLDLFRIPMVGTQWFFTQELKQAIEKNQLTGLKFNEIKN